MEDLSDTITFPGCKYPVARNYFTVYDIRGVEHQMIAHENLTDKYNPYENIMQRGIIDNYLRIVGGDDGHMIYSYQNIILPAKFTGEVTIKHYNYQKFDRPIVLSSINHDSFCERFDYGKYKSNLTPLQEMMYQDIITIMRGFLDEDDRDKDFKEIFEEGYDVLDYAQQRCSGAIEMIEKHINGIMFEAMYYLADEYNYNYKIMHLPFSIQIQCVEMTTKVMSLKEFNDFIANPHARYSVISVNCNNESISIPENYFYPTVRIELSACKSIEAGRNSYIAIARLYKSNGISIKNGGTICFYQDDFVRDVKSVDNFGVICVLSKTVNTIIGRLFNRGKLFIVGTPKIEGNLFDNIGIIETNVRLENSEFIGNYNPLSKESTEWKFDDFKNSGLMKMYSNCENLSTRVNNTGIQVVYGKLNFTNGIFENLLGQIKSYGDITIIANQKFVNGSKGEDEIREISVDVYKEIKRIIYSDLRLGKNLCSKDLKRFYITNWIFMPDWTGVAIEFEDCEPQLYQDKSQVKLVIPKRHDDCGKILSKSSISINGNCDIDNDYGVIASRDKTCINSNKNDVKNLNGVIFSEDSIFLNGKKLNNHEVQQEIRSKNPKVPIRGSIPAKFSFYRLNNGWDTEHAGHQALGFQYSRNHDSCSFSWEKLDQPIHCNAFRFNRQLPQLKEGLFDVKWYLSKCVVWDNLQYQVVRNVKNMIVDFEDVFIKCGSNGLIICTNPTEKGKIELNFKHVDCGRLICSNGEIINADNAPIETIEGGMINCKKADLGERNLDLQKLFVVASDVNMTVSDFKHTIQKNFGGEFDLSELAEIFDLLDSFDD